jgi:outer membrane murein-binding lipoprotein Lpp
MAGLHKVGKEIAKGLRRYTTDERPEYVTPQWFDAATKQFAEWRHVVGLLVVGGSALIGVDQWILSKHFDNKIDPVAFKVEKIEGDIANLKEDVAAIRKKIGA